MALSRMLLAVARGVAIHISQSMSRMSTDLSTRTRKALGYRARLVLQCVTVCVAVCCSVLSGVGVSCEACRRSINDSYFFLWGLMQGKQKQSFVTTYTGIWVGDNPVDQQVFLLCFLWVQTLKWYRGFSNMIALVPYSRRHRLSIPRVANWNHPCSWRTFQAALTKGCTALCYMVSYGGFERENWGWPPFSCFISEGSSPRPPRATQIRPTVSAHSRKWGLRKNPFHQMGYSLRIETRDTLYECIKRCL